MNKGILLTALSALLYGCIGYFGTRLLDLGLSVKNMLFWRFFCSSLCLLPILLLVFRRNNLSNKFKALANLLFLGGIFHGSSTALYFEASKTIGTGLAMVIFFSYPIFVALLSFFLRKIPISRITFSALILIFFGCLLIASSSVINTNFNVIGLTQALMAGLCYGTYVFYSKELSSALSPVLSTLCVCLGSLGIFALYLLLDFGHFQVPHNFEAWMLLSLFALFGTVLPVLLLLAGMKYLSASTASIISVLEPIAVLGVGVFILGEPLQALQLLGAAIILSATILVYIKPPPALQPEAQRDLG
jgi:drug/metabolite transporter (DMT)-like permease